MNREVAFTHQPKQSTKRQKEATRNLVTGCHIVQYGEAAHKMQTEEKYN